MKSHREFYALVSGLNSSDKGNMMEHWYRAVYGADTAKHVGVTRSFPSGANERKLDLFEVTTSPRGQVQGQIKELKSGEKAIGVGKTKRGLDRDAEFWKQFGDYLYLGGRKVDGVEVEKLTYVFTSPVGARRNRVAMEQMFALAREAQLPFAIEFFDDLGRRHIITKRSDVAAMLDAAFGGKP